MYSPRERVVLRSGRYCNIPRPTRARQRDRNHASPRGRPTRGSRGPTTPHKVLRGVLQRGGKPPDCALAQISSGRAGYHLGLAMLCLAQWIQRRWQSTGTVPWIWAILTAHTQIEAGPETQKDAPLGPQHSLTCGYHAIHMILRRGGLSPELAYPSPTTDQEVHQIRMLVCEILAAAAEDGKLLLQTARPTTDHTSALLQADTYTDTTHRPGAIPAPAPPLPLPTRRPTHAHHRVHPRAPRHGKQQHRPATDPPAGHPSPPPTPGSPHTPTARSPTPHGTPTPPSGPHTPPAHTPENPGPPPPAPECSPRKLCPPADANAHNLTHCRTQAQPSREGEDRSPAPPSCTAVDQIGPLGCQVTAGPPRPPTPNLQPEDMPSILPAVAAAEAAAHKPATARITAQPVSPKTTTSSLSSSSWTSFTSYPDPPLPADLINKATAKVDAAAARQATGGPPTPTQATQAPRQHTRNPPHPAPVPLHLRTEVLLNPEPDPNPKPVPKPKPAPQRSHQQQQHHPQHHPTQPPTSQK